MVGLVVVDTGFVATRLGPVTGSLTAESVVRTAIQVLDEHGLDGVTARAIAKRLGVTMQTVLWHVGSKSRLLQLMADMIAGEVTYDALPDRWDARVRDLLGRFRAALLRHRESARLFVANPGADPKIAKFSEALVEALLEGLPQREAAWTNWTLYYFMIGLIQEEQSRSNSLNSQLTELLSGDAYPALRVIAAELDESTFHDRFRFGMDTILRSADSCDGAT
jgi:TetR/AcrR family tetracycline transcriptional repressor